MRAEGYAPRVIRSEVRDHVAEVVIDNPPGERAARWPAGSSSPTRSVRMGRDPNVRALIVAANPEIKGYQAGVDIKELAADPTNASLIGVNRGCWETFAAVYDCEVPVIAAVHGYCLGGGVGIAGNADIVVAADDATFGLPEVDRGALGVATHLSRLVPTAQDAGDVLHGLDDHGAAAARVGDGRAGRPARRADGRGARDRAGHRGEEPARDPAGEGVAERDRPRRREEELPLRAGLHVRAQPLGRLRRAAPGVRRQARRRPARRLRAARRVGRTPREQGRACPSSRATSPRRAAPPGCSAATARTCGAYFFPKQYSFCRNPACGAPDLDDVELSTRGTLWSFTDNRFAPPPPYPAGEPFEPYGVAAVELADEQMIVLGQLGSGYRRRVACTPGRRWSSSSSRSTRTTTPSTPCGSGRWWIEAASSDVVILGAGMHPWGKWGRNFVEYGVVAARAALADAGLDWSDVGFLAAGNTMRNGYPGYVSGSTFAQALGWRGVRVSSSVRGVRVGRGRRRPGARADPGRSLRRRARGRRRHRAEGLLRPAPGRAARGPRLGAVPRPRRDEPHLLRALRASAHGAVRRDHRRTSRRSR